MGKPLKIARAALLLALAFWTGAAMGADVHQMPPDFVDVHSLDPTISIDMRYFGSHNFVGHPVPGYMADKCFLTRSAAEALTKIQLQLREFGLSLKLYDCYRPQSAVDYFEQWAKDSSDAAMKEEFYPRVPKSKLIPHGYIASPSSHSRGSTVDVTITADREKGAPVAGAFLPSCGVRDLGTLDMGTGFDCFDESAHVHAPDLPSTERANRMLLQSLFVHAGFKPYADEWWHFTLKDEPYPATYFDFPVK